MASGATARADHRRAPGRSVRSTSQASTTSEHDGQRDGAKLEQHRIDDQLTNARAENKRKGGRPSGLDGDPDDETQRQQRDERDENRPAHRKGSDGRARGFGKRSSVRLLPPAALRCFDANSNTEVTHGVGEQAQRHRRPAAVIRSVTILLLRLDGDRPSVPGGR